MRLLRPESLKKFIPGKNWKVERKEPVGRLAILTGRMVGKKDPVGKLIDGKALA